MHFFKLQSSAVLFTATSPWCVALVVNDMRVGKVPVGSGGFSNPRVGRLG